MEPTAAAGWRRYDEPDLPRILDAALETFAEQGYHGTSIRHIAARAGLSVPGLYHHYQSKQEILIALMMVTMDDLLARTAAAVEGAGDEPEAEFDAVVENLLRFHMFRQRQALVSSTEIRSLEPPHRDEYVARRDEQQAILERAIRRGVEGGAFTTHHPHDAARALASMCVGVSTWYRPDGELTAEEIVARHLGLARSLVGARTA